MKNVAMIDNYNPIIPGASAIVVTNDRELKNDYLTLGYIIAQVNIKMAANKTGVQL